MNLQELHFLASLLFSDLLELHFSYISDYVTRCKFALFYQPHWVYCCHIAWPQKIIVKLIYNFIAFTNMQRNIIGSCYRFFFRSKHKSNWFWKPITKCKYLCGVEWSYIFFFNENVNQNEKKSSVNHTKSSDLSRNNLNLFQFFFYYVL